MAYQPLPPVGQDDMAGSLPVVLASDQSAVPVTGTFWQATQPVSGTVGISGSVAVTATDLDIRNLASGTDSVSAVQSGAWNITNISGTVSLPTGASTSANQTTMITSLQLIDDVVHSGDASLSKYAVIGAVFDDASTSTVTENNAHALRMSSRRALLVEGVSGGTAITVSATNLDVRDLSSSTDSVSAVQSGTWNVGVTGTAAVTQSGAWNITNISGTISLPTGAATAAKQPALGTAGTASADVITVQGITGMTALKVDGSAVTQPVSGTVAISGSVAVTGTFWQATQPVSIAAAVPVTDNSGSLTVDAPVGTPVFVRLSDGSSAITTLPVSLASVPSHAVTNAGTFAVQAAQSGTWNITNISGTISLPTGASTLAEQQTQTTALQLIDDIVQTEDAAHVSGHKGVMMFGVRQDTQANFGADGDYVPFSVDASGALRVTSTGGSAGTQYAVDVALGATPTGTLTGFKRDDALSALTPVEGDMVEGRVDANGSIWVTLGTRLDKVNDEVMVWGNTAKDGSGTDYIPLLDSDGHQQVDVLSVPSITVGTLPATPAGTNLIGRISASDETSTVYNGTTALTPKFAIITASASGNTSVVASVASKKIRVLAYNYMANGTVNVKFQSNTTDKTGLAYLIANTGKVAGYNKLGWFETAAGEALNINLSAAIAVGGEITYIEV